MTTSRGRLAGVLHDLAVEGAGYVQEQQRVSGRCGIDHNELVAAPAEELTERLEHRHFL